MSRRGRCASGGRRAPAARRRRDAALVRVRRLGRRSSAASPFRRAGRTRARRVPRRLLRERRPAPPAARRDGTGEAARSSSSSRRPSTSCATSSPTARTGCAVPVAGIARLLETPIRASPERRSCVSRVIDLANPHATLGAHPHDGGVVVRAFRPEAVSVRVKPEGDASRRAEAGRSAGPLRGRSSTARRAAPLRARGRLPGRERVHAARPVRLPADARRPRPAPRRRGPPRAALRAARRARAGGRRRHRDALRGVGAVTRAVSASSATSTAGTAACTRCGRSARPGIWELFVPDVGEGTATSSRSTAPTAHLHLKADPVAFDAELPPRHGLDRLPLRVRVGRRRLDRAPPRGGAADAVRSASTRSTSARGAGRSTAGRSRYLELADQLADYVRRPRLHARRAPAGDGAPVRRLVGLPGDRLLRAARRASARPTTSARSSTRCTSTASA